MWEYRKIHNKKNRERKNMTSSQIWRVIYRRIVPSRILLRINSSKLNCTIDPWITVIKNLRKHAPVSYISRKRKPFTRTTRAQTRGALLRNNTFGRHRQLRAWPIRRLNRMRFDRIGESARITCGMAFPLRERIRRRHAPDTRRRRRNESSWIKGSLARALARHVPRGLTRGLENPDGVDHLFCPPARPVCAPVAPQLAQVFV